jgi:hypothetical protein
LRVSQKPARAITGKWGFKVKSGADNLIKRFKARWVVRGLAQICGVDYFETYPPTAKPASIGLIFSLAAAWGLRIVQVDFLLAFLQGDFSNGEVIYVQQPTGFEDGTNHVCQLLLSLYSVKQSARNRHQKISGLLGGRPLLR